MNTYEDNCLCKYVDPFYGNCEPELPMPNETASKWFFLKAQTGNTLPAAVRPFGMVSACAYTGGYPNGYTPYLPNSYARPRRLIEPDKMTAMGFSHFHQSGTGHIGYFYNYSIITPVAGHNHHRLERFSLTGEKAAPGYYSCKLGDVFCEVTVTDFGAVYRFVFNEQHNTVVFDPVLNGIFKAVDTPMSNLGETVSLTLNDNGYASSGVAFSSGIKLYTALSCTGCTATAKTDDERIVFSVSGKEIYVRVGFSFKNSQKADDNLRDAEAKGLENAKEESSELWNKVLAKIQIDGDDAYKTKFYSNFYHSLIKPICLTGNNEFFGDDDCYADLATLWDMCKTQLPLIFALYPEVSSGIVRSMLKSGELAGHFQNSLLLMDFISRPGPCDMQARALTVNSLYDAYLRGVKDIDWNRALDMMVAEMNIEANRAFLEGKEVSEYASHTIDLAVAANSISCLAAELGKTDIARRYASLADSWTIVYDEKTGVIADKGSFYEGCNLNYSFRLLPNMEKRIETAGGKEAFERSLDKFFGFDKSAAKQCLDTNDKETLKLGEARKGFEGFNNETDMETPYCYCFIGRHDKTCDIVRSGEKYMFGMSGRGALCGNDDSGGLGSLYVCNALGVFPCFGQDKIILGSPAVKGALLTLANGNKVNVVTENFDENSFVPKEIYFNGKRLSTPFITVKQFMNGGELKFIF